MKTREEAEARALELFPKTHIATVNELHEVSRKAFLKCWDEMQLAMDAKQADVKVEGVSDGTEGVTEGVIEGVTEGVSGNQTCGFCVEKAQQDKQDESKCCGELIEYKDCYECPKCDKIIPKSQDKQTCGFCVEPKEVEMIECPDCNGEGTWYNDTSRQCTTYRGDCCGGCGYDVECDTCNGTGEIEKEEE